MRLTNVILSAALISATFPAIGQNYGQYPDRRDNNGQYRDNDGQYRNNRGNNTQFYNGVRQGGRGGQYYDQRHANDGYDQRYQQNNGYYRQRQGGIGPGKGALIGGAGGAVLGALFGGGLKGSIIGGAAGAGIGAVAGKAHQDSQRRDDYYPR